MVHVMKLLCWDVARLIVGTMEEKRSMCYVEGRHTIAYHVCTSAKRGGRRMRWSWAVHSSCANGPDTQQEKSTMSENITTVLTLILISKRSLCLRTHCYHRENRPSYCVTAVPKRYLLSVRDSDPTPGAFAAGTHLSISPLPPR